MGRQLNYIISAFLLLIVILGLFQFIKKIPVDHSATREELVTEAMPEAFPVMSTLAAQGKAIFQSKCASCHNIFKETAYPALIGFEERGPWVNRSKLYEWIKNPPGFMKTDAYTRSLKDKFGSVMTAFPDLKNEEIDAIIEYINQEAVNKMKPMPVASR